MVDPRKRTTLGNYSMLLPSTGRVVMLYINAVDTAFLSMEEAGTDYQVPTGKKFVCCDILQMAPSSGSINPVDLKQTDAADSGTGAVSKVRFGGVGAITAHYDGALKEFAANKYVTLSRNTNMPTGVIIILGVELDA